MQKIYSNDSPTPNKSSPCLSPAFFRKQRTNQPGGGKGSDRNLSEENEAGKPADLF